MYKYGSEDFIVKIVNRKRLAKRILLLLSFFQIGKLDLKEVN